MFLLARLYQILLYYVDVFILISFLRHSTTNPPFRNSRVLGIMIMSFLLNSSSSALTWLADLDLYVFLGLMASLDLPCVLDVAVKCAMALLLTFKSKTCGPYCCSCCSKVLCICHM